ncbi:MAG: response regulator [Actinomycetota bacterium]
MTEGTNPIRIVVADDHTMLRRIVQMACEERESLELVGEAGDGPQAVEAVLEHRPDVLVLDLSLPHFDGFEVARRVKQEAASTKILILTARDDARAVFDSMRADVEGFLDKSSDMDEIADAIEKIAAGERAFTAEQERGALDQLGSFLKRARESSRVGGSLTARELEVLLLIREGLTTRQMATRLHVSQRTVESHIEKLYRKLGVNSRVQAVARGAELGMFEPPESP